MCGSTKAAAVPVVPDSEGKCALWFISPLSSVLFSFTSPVTPLSSESWGLHFEFMTEVKWNDNDAIIWSFQITFIMALSDELILEYIV